MAKEKFTNNDEILSQDFDRMNPYKFNFDRSKKVLKDLTDRKWMATVEYWRGRGWGWWRNSRETKRLNNDVSIDKLTPWDKITPEQEEVIRQQLANKKSPVTFEMVRDSSIVHNVPVELLLAVMQNDSWLWTVGKWAKTHNPWNVWNTDSWGTKDFWTREKWVDACAENIRKRIDAYMDKVWWIPIIWELLTWISRAGIRFFWIYMTDPNWPGRVLSIVKTWVKKLFGGN